MGGMGFGVIAGVVAFSNVLKESGGPGIVGVNGGSQFFVLTSGMVHLYIQYRGNFIIYITKLFGVSSIPLSTCTCIATVASLSTFSLCYQRSDSPAHLLGCVVV